MSGDSLVRPPPTGNITRSWWRGQINNPEETRLRRVVATAKLVLREHASLESRKIGDVLRGTRVLVLDEDLIDGVVRVHLGNDTSPRGACVHRLGWVTAFKEGELKLAPTADIDGAWSPSATASAHASSPGDGGSLAAGSASGASGAAGAAETGADGAGGQGSEDRPFPQPDALPWSTVRLTKRVDPAQIPSDFFKLRRTPQSDTEGSTDSSMASRIARRRARRAGQRSNRLSVRPAALISAGIAADEDGSAPAPTTSEIAAELTTSLNSNVDTSAMGSRLGSRSATPAATRSGAPTPDTSIKLVWSTSATLLEVSAGLLKAADEMESSAQATFDTVQSKLGRLLNERRMDIGELMKEWDRNRDGDISKQEFRLNVKKLGLNVPTPELDGLYDSLDLDGSGSLDIGEMKGALKAMTYEVRNVKDSVERVKKHAARRREVAALFRAAANDTVLMEAARGRLEAYRECAKDGTAPSKLAAPLKEKGSDLSVVWGDSVGEATFRSKFKAMGSEAGEDEFAEAWQRLCYDPESDRVNGEDLSKMLSMAALTGSLKNFEMRKVESAMQKAVATVKKTAEESQKVARSAEAQADAEALEAEREQREAAKARASADAGAKERAKEAKRQAEKSAEARRLNRFLAGSPGEALPAAPAGGNRS